MTIRPAYSTWPTYNRRLRDVVAAMTEEQLALRPSSERWPLWATVGHLACQRVFWLCDFAAEPGAETTRFTNAGYNCPGDDDLDHVLSADQLVEALDSTFRIVEGCLDRWTLGMLDEEIRRADFGEGWAHARGWVIQRVFSHDVYHCAELNETLSGAGLPQIELWSLFPPTSPCRPRSSARRNATPWVPSTPQSVRGCSGPASEGPSAAGHTGIGLAGRH